MTHINLIVIKTDDLQGQFELYSALGIEFHYHKHGSESRGVTIILEPSQSDWGYGAIIQDLDGRKIELTETKAKD